MKIQPQPEPAPVQIPHRAAPPAALKAAREFEQIFLRKMLGSLEKTGQMSGGGSSGGGIYSSMVVNALADAISSAGGIGLADVIAKSAGGPLPSAAPDPVSSTSSLDEAASSGGCVSEHQRPTGRQVLEPGSVKK